MKILTAICSLFFILLTISCKENREDSKEQVLKLENRVLNNVVDTMTLKKGIFEKELLTNGKLTAVNKVDISFEVTGKIESILYKNGDYVNKGDVIAILCSKEAKIKLSQAKERLDKAELDFFNELIGYGYGSDTSNVPNELLNVLKIKTGLNSIKNDLIIVERNLENHTLKSPFDGRVANMRAREHEFSSKDFCTIIDDREFEVSFYVLETDLDQIKLGLPVSISPFGNSDYSLQGIITQINPTINDKGQILCIGSVKNRRDLLVDGMNVRVVLKNRILDRYVVPKSAVVLRDNLYVLFALDAETNKAEWVYVNILDSNLDSHMIEPNLERSAKLEEGSIIITSGNMNLAHGSNVIIK
jgi:RND family efflux transporter MFP subunit